MVHLVALVDNLVLGFVFKVRVRVMGMRPIDRQQSARGPEPLDETTTCAVDRLHLCPLWF
jgi:hypothetical protein